MPEQTRRRWRFRPTRRFGLRARITVAFGLGALLLSMLLAGIVYGLTRQNLLSQRESSSTASILDNAVNVDGTLRPDADITEVLSSVPARQGPSIIRYQDQWLPSNEAEFGDIRLPVELREAVLSGEAARMRTTLDGSPTLMVGVPLPDSQAYFFQAAPLEDIEETLDSLAVSLLGAAAVTIIAGAGLGFYASRRVLKPLTEMGSAAEAIAGGRLDTRLVNPEDVDLTPITGSFNDMAQALQDRIERDARFASEVSHELRSPLMTVAASLEVLQNSKSGLPDRAQTALDLLALDIERFQQLVEDLLEISRFDAGAVHLQLDDVLVADLVRQAVTTIVGPRVPVVVDPEAATMVVEVDKRRIGQVLANLLDNAEKYAGGATSVRVTASDPVTVQIAVEDAGQGVPTEERDVIFDRFSRGSAGGRRGADLGTGLGLALVDEHIRLHGGQVWVTDRVDRRSGARFVVQLPVIENVADELMAPPLDVVTPDGPTDSTASDLDLLR
jgi:two-component system sensor histidine kinase MtrB